MPAYKQVTLPIIRFALQAAIDRRSDLGLDISVKKGARNLLDGMLENVIYQFETKLLSGEPEVTLGHTRRPLTWWDHVKYTFNEWCLERGGFWSRFAFRFCIEFETITVRTQTLYKVCPHLAVSGTADHVRFLTVPIQEDTAFEASYNRGVGVAARYPHPIS